MENTKQKPLPTMRQYYYCINDKYYYLLSQKEECKHVFYYMKKLYDNVVYKIGDWDDCYTYLKHIDTMLAILHGDGFFSHEEISYIKQAIVFQETTISY